MRKIAFLISTFLLLISNAIAAEYTIVGYVTDAITKLPLAQVNISVDTSKELLATTNQAGYFELSLRYEDHKTITFSLGQYEKKILSFDKIDRNKLLAIKLEPQAINLKAVQVTGMRNTEEIAPMKMVSDLAIYSGMKSEVISIKNITANLATNNSRQVYNRIAGVNIWENDGAGMQLGIGARGLSPNRTSNFNVKQNLYDISADALGYPESYYTPALQGVARVELIRGASALQYGSQFGGLLNFRMIQPKLDGSKEILLEQNVSSFGLADTVTNAIATTTSFVSANINSEKTGFYGYYQYKQGEGWRTRSDFDVNSAFGALHHKFSDKWMLKLDYTHMSYLTQQAGGLTDAQFDINPRMVTRHRNWFQVNWNIASGAIIYEPNSTFKLESKVFKLNASREALGHLGQIQRPDPMTERDLISSDFQNFGFETRMLHKKEVKSRFIVLATGVRLYQGDSNTQQGRSSSGALDDFEFDHNVADHYSNFDFPNWNVAAYAQTHIPVAKHFSINPGLRYELINTQSDGYYRSVIRDGALNIIEDTLLYETRSRERDFVLMGIGFSYKPKSVELYANAVQNYRAINFTDMQVKNTSLVIDPHIQDERGYNFDLGFRGKVKKQFQFDASVFALLYNQRIGEYFTTDNLNRAIRLRSNIADAYSAGLEFFVQDNLLRHWGKNSDKKLTLFINSSFIHSEYVSSKINAFDGKKVELVPNVTLRTGLGYSNQRLSSSMQLSYIGEQFSDATNVGSDPNFPSTPNAVHGIIPSYMVMDFSASYSLKKWKLSMSVNNLTNSHYFTRRASGYPGPGIIPSDGRSYHLGLSWRFEG